MDAGGDTPPFNWQPPTTVLYRRQRRPTPLFDSSLAIVLLPCLALLLLFLLFHSFKSPPQQLPQQFYIPQMYQNQIPNVPVQVPVPILPPQRPAQFFRRSWDSLNVVLIVAAILCGVFARRNEDAPPPPPTPSLPVLPKRNQFSFPDFHHPHQVQHQPWCQFGDNRRMYGCSPRRRFGGGAQVEIRGGGGGGLRRTSSAYPDFMRNEASLWEEENRRLRFFDDNDINRFYSPPDTDYTPNLENQAADTYAADTVEDPTVADDEIEVKETPVDDFVAIPEIEVAEEEVVESAPPSPPPMSPAPPPPPPPPTRSKPKRTYQSVPRKEKPEKSAPPPPAPPEKKLRRKKSNTTKEIAMVLASLYTSGKRKRKHQSKTENQDPPIPIETPPPERRFPPPSPPPPPPPLPPPPFFSNFFKKSTKHKKIHSVSSAPPAPPPPPIRNFQDPPMRTNSNSRKPPLPARANNTGSHSRVVQIQSPRPPMMPEMRYAAVRTWSAESSPEVDLTATGDVEARRASDGGREINGGDSSGPATATCPSPDVNTKADSFIARHHNGWRLEKLNSWREKRA